MTRHLLGQRSECAVFGLVVWLASRSPGKLGGDQDLLEGCGFVRQTSPRLPIEVGGATDPEPPLRWPRERQPGIGIHYCTVGKVCAQSGLKMRRNDIKRRHPAG